MTILVVDPSEIARSALAELLCNAGYTVEGATELKSARNQFRQTDFSLLLINSSAMADEDGHVFLHAGKQTRYIVLGNDLSVDQAVGCMKDGALDVLRHPCDPEVLLQAVRSAVPETRSTETEPTHYYGMIGESPSMQGLYKYLQRAAPTEATVLIRGETGSGKELAARATHALSQRRSAAFVAVNCAAIPETLVEAELFGSEKGAFTGAVANRKGLVEAADKGTLFLDEIGELPLEAQARLLRVLQEGEVRRVGAIRTRQVDVRIIAATHRDLAELVRIGRFREDLYYRLNVLAVEVPPLRARRDDIPLLADALLKRHAKSKGFPLRGIAPTAMKLLMQQAWPGNVRELDNVLLRTCIMSNGPLVAAGDLQFDTMTVETSRIPADAVDPENPANQTLEEYLEQFLRTNQNDMTETEIARNLGISRKCLWEKRQKLGIPRPQRKGEVRSDPTRMP